MRTLASTFILLKVLFMLRRNIDITRRKVELKHGGCQEWPFWNSHPLLLQQTLVEWMKLLARASHDYMKLQVYELEQKLIELESIETKRKTKQQTPIGVSNVLPPPNGHHSLSTGITFYSTFYELLTHYSVPEYDVKVKYFLPAKMIIPIYIGESNLLHNIYWIKWCFHIKSQHALQHLCPLVTIFTLDSCQEINFSIWSTWPRATVDISSNL